MLSTYINWTLIVVKVLLIEIQFNTFDTSILRYIINILTVKQTRNKSFLAKFVNWEFL